MNNNIENNICQAIDIIVDKKISELQFNRTVSAKIIEKLDNDEYILQYQDVKIKAYAINGAEYFINEMVYVIIPNNNSNMDKYILTSKAKQSSSGNTLPFGYLNKVVYNNLGKVSTLNGYIENSSINL